MIRISTQKQKTKIDVIGGDGDLLIIKTSRIVSNHDVFETACKVRGWTLSRWGFSGDTQYICVNDSDGNVVTYQDLIDNETE